MLVVTKYLEHFALRDRFQCFVYVQGCIDFVVARHYVGLVQALQNGQLSGDLHCVAEITRLSTKTFDISATGTMLEPLVGPEAFVAMGVIVGEPVLVENRQNRLEGSDVEGVIEAAVTRFLGAF